MVLGRRVFVVLLYVAIGLLYEGLVWFGWGAWGHLAERHLSRDLSKAVRMVAARQPWLPRRLSAAIVAELV